MTDSTFSIFRDLKGNRVTPLSVASKSTFLYILNCPEVFVKTASRWFTVCMIKVKLFFQLIAHL